MFCPETVRLIVLYWCRAKYCYFLCSRASVGWRAPGGVETGGGDCEGYGGWQVLGQRMLREKNGMRKGREGKGNAEERERRRKKREGWSKYCTIPVGYKGRVSIVIHVAWVYLPRAPTLST